MPEHPLIIQMKDWGGDLVREFEKSSSKGGKESASDVAKFRESAVSDFVANFFPFPYRVVKGVIRDVNGQESASVDVILLASNHPNTIHKKENAALIIADGVEAAIEVKSNSASSQEISTFLQQSAKTKKLRRVNHSLFMESQQRKKIGTENWPNYLDFLKEVPYFVFFMKPEPNSNKFLKKICRKCSEVPLRLQPDFIVVNNTGIIVNEKFPNLTGYSNPGLFYEHWGERTMAGFLLLLNMVHPAQPRMATPALEHYLRPMRSDIERWMLDDCGNKLPLAPAP